VGSLLDDYPVTVDIPVAWGDMVTFDGTAGCKVAIPEDVEGRIRALERVPVERLAG